MKIDWNCLIYKIFLFNITWSKNITVEFVYIIKRDWNINSKFVWYEKLMSVTYAA